MKNTVTDNLFDVHGKVALVTGGARGLGRMIADGLARAGVQVYITSRKIDSAKEAAQQISQFGKCTGIAADLSSPDAARLLACTMEKHESKIDILINNAGKTWGAPFESFPDEAWPSIMAVNVQQPFTLIQKLLPFLKAAGTKADPARVINIGSVAGLKQEPIPAYSYAASKAALHHLSKILAADLAKYHVTVNVIVPGYFPTRMTAHLREQGRETKLAARIPLARLGSPQDIAGMCIFLASRAGAYITGAQLPLDGGLSGCS